MDRLKDFLGSEDDDAAAATAEQDPPQQEQAAAPTPAPEKAAEAPVAADHDEDADLPQGPMVPRDALIKARRDHKARADRAEGESAAVKAERDALRAELEALRKAPPVAPQPVQQAPQQAQEPERIPNPVEDPAGYHAYQQRALFNHTLNMSEAMVRQQYGDEDVDAKLEVFKEEAAKNPALAAQLASQAHPYRWVYQQAQRIMAMREIGDDPAKFREKTEVELKAKLRAEWEAEQAQALAAVGQVAQPQVRLPQSLGTMRSAAPRGEVVDDAPDDLAGILAMGRKRR